MAWNERIGEAMRRLQEVNQKRHESHYDALLALCGNDQNAFRRVVNSPLGSVLFNFFEERFIFEKSRQYGKQDGLESPEIYGLSQYQPMTLELQNERYTAWYKKAGEGMPTFAYCHGSKGALDDRAAVLNELASRGFGVMIVAYPGFFGSELDADGKPQSPSQEGCYRAASAMLQALCNEKVRHIIPLGESLGVNVALTEAERMEHMNRLRRRNGHASESEIAAVVGINPFFSMREWMRKNYPEINVSHMRNIFPSNEIIDKVHAPVYFFHSLRDEITRPSHSKRLQQLAEKNVTLEFIPGANHRLSTADGNEADREQITLLVDKLQNLLAAQRLCPQVGEDMDRYRLRQARREQFANNGHRANGSGASPHRGNGHPGRNRSDESLSR